MNETQKVMIQDLNQSNIKVCVIVHVTSVVQKMDDTVYWIKHYPGDKH